jgi:23S rRNA (guanine745-N1)-methyltransferase
MSIIICPYCQNTLSDSGEKTYTCENNHSFDLAKQGYLNLLPVNQKKSSDPGDNEMMIAARRHFLELGHYDPLIASIKQVISDQLAFDTNDIIALDAGCGEGYYSKKVFSDLPKLQVNVFGTDISKYAVKQAAKTYKDHFYFVSSVYNLPIATASTDLILSVFSPIAEDEFKRVLTLNGAVIIVTPAADHLHEMAALIYDNVKPHSSNAVEKMSTHFTHDFSRRTTFKIELTSKDDLLSLLKMTPYYWSTEKHRLENITTKNQLSVTCDFRVDVFRVKEEN